jgi:hypothetical protein
MNTALKVICLAVATLGGAAQASVVTFETASSVAGPQGSAAAYQAVVNAAIAAPGSNSTTLALFDNITNSGVFGGSNQNLAERFTIDFGVSAAKAGNWGLRAGVDFGNGGAIFLDGVALAFNANDMWWAGSYANTAGTFDFSPVAIGAGNHTLQLFGLENCCDGGQQAQFSLDGQSYTTFGARDGLNVTAVPEPETYALMLAGLGAIGFVARRRTARSAA